MRLTPLEWGLRAPITPRLGGNGWGATAPWPNWSRPKKQNRPETQNFGTPLPPIKCILGCRHWLANSSRGVAIEIYLALIAALLLQLYSGRRPNRRMMENIELYLLGVGESRSSSRLAMPILGSQKHKKLNCLPGLSAQSCQAFACPDDAALAFSNETLPFYRKAPNDITILKRSNSNSLAEHYWRSACELRRAGWDLASTRSD